MPMSLGRWCVVLCLCALTRSAAAQQRPLVTEDPESIGAGRVLVEAGIEYAHDAVYPVSGLGGNLWRLPALGLSFGISSVAEIQIDGSAFDHLSITSRNFSAPLASLVTATGTSTSDVGDLVVATKVRVLSETPGRPSAALRFATKLPNASNE